MQSDWKSALIAGYEAFRAGRYNEQHALYEELASKGQKPKIMVIACSDSRADPADIFNSGPGELFVLRNVANIVPPFAECHSGTGSAIEYAVNVLKVDAIIVLSHEDCGGIGAYLSGGAGTSEFIGDWVAHLKPSGIKESGLTGADAIRAACEVSLNNLSNYPFVKTAMAEGRLQLIGGFFGIGHGQLSLFDGDEWSDLHAA